MKCESCGKEIDSDCLICPYCNDEVTTEKKEDKTDFIDNIVETAEPNSVVDLENGKKPNKKLLYLIAGCIACLAIIGSIVAGVYFSSQETVSIEETEPELTEVELRDQYISKCEALSYDELKEAAEDSSEVYVAVFGLVSSVYNNENEYVIGLNITSDGNDWIDTIYITCPTSISSFEVKENAMLSIYGECNGLYKPEQSDIDPTPWVKAQYIEPYIANADKEDEEAEEKKTNGDSKEQSVNEVVAPATAVTYYESLYTCEDLNMRYGPGTNYNKIMTLGMGAKVDVYGYSNTGWCYVKYNGNAGWVKEDWLTPYYVEYYWCDICQDYLPPHDHIDYFPDDPDGEIPDDNGYDYGTNIDGSESDNDYLTY